MKKIKDSIIITLLLCCLFFTPQEMALAEENAYTGETNKQDYSENPDTGIAETVGTGAVLFLGGGSLAGTLLLRKLHSEYQKDKNRHC